MSFDMDDLYIEYQDKVEAGEIDPKEVSIEDYVAGRMADMVDRAYDDYKETERTKKETL